MVVVVAEDEVAVISAEVEVEEVTEAEAVKMEAFEEDVVKAVEVEQAAKAAAEASEAATKMAGSSRSENTVIQAIVEDKGVEADLIVAANSLKLTVSKKMAIKWAC